MQINNVLSLDRVVSLGPFAANSTNKVRYSAVMICGTLPKATTVQDCTARKVDAAVITAYRNLAVHWIM